MDGEVFIYSGETWCGPGVREGPEGEDETGSRISGIGLLGGHLVRGTSGDHELSGGL